MGVVVFSSFRFFGSIVFQILELCPFLLIHCAMSAMPLDPQKKHRWYVIRLLMEIFMLSRICIWGPVHHFWDVILQENPFLPVLFHLIRFPSLLRRRCPSIISPLQELCILRHPTSTVILGITMTHFITHTL